MSIFLNKLGDIAKSAVDKTGEMLEITKLNSKITTEQSKIAGYKAKIGEYYYEQMCNASDAPAEIVEYCGMIKSSLDEIASLQLEVESLKGEKPAEAAPPTDAKCPACGAQNTPGIKFCGECGQKLQ